MCSALFCLITLVLKGKTEMLIGKTKKAHTTQGWSFWEQKRRKDEKKEQKKLKSTEEKERKMRIEEKKGAEKKIEE